MPESELEGRVARLEGRVEGFEARFDGLDRRLDRVDQRLDALDLKISRHFIWTVGIQVAVLLAVVTALTR